MQGCLGEKAETHPLLPSSYLSLAVHPQANHRYPADWGTAYDLPALRNNLEMMLPLIFPWVEKTDHRVALGITAADVRSLIEIAEATTIIPLMITAVDPQLIIR
jgi:hypothetical protein